MQIYIIIIGVWIDDWTGCYDKLNEPKNKDNLECGLSLGTEESTTFIVNK